MKKIMIAMALMLMLLSAGCSKTNDETAQTSTPAPEAITAPDTATATEAPESESELLPSLLLTDEYNPFSDIEWMDRYHIFMASYETWDYNMYHLYLTWNGDAEDVVIYISDLLGDWDEERIDKSLGYLESTGQVTIYGVETALGPSTEASIEKIRGEDYDYAAAEGYVISLTQQIEGDNSAYQSLLEANINTEVLVDLAGILDMSAYSSREIKVNTDAGYVEFFGVYQPDNYDEIIETLKASAAWETTDGFRRYYGDMSVNITYDNQSKTIFISQRMDAMDSAIGGYSYSPKASLVNLGFNNFGDSCGYKDETTGVWLSVRKEEWGSSDGDCIMCSFTFYDQPCFIVIDYPNQIYNVMLGEDDDRVDYAYDAFADTITYSEIFVDEASFMAAVAEKTGETSDMVVYEPVMFVDDFTFQTFGYKPEGLFELPVE